VSPNTRSLLPFSLTDFSVHVETTTTGDGGVWLRAINNPASTVGVDGLLFVARPTLGDAYFQISQNGSFGPVLNQVSITPGPHKFDISVSGNNFTVYADGSTTPFTSVNSAVFTQGQMGLYDLSPLGFDNFSLYDFKTGSATTLTSSANPSSADQPVTFTATVTPVGATGSVNFYDGAVSLGTVALTGGTATFTTSTLSVATHTVTARYSGDATYSSGASASLSQVVGMGASSISMTSAPNPSAFGQNVLLTASVTPVSATGTVTFYVDDISAGSGTLANGVVTLNVAALSTGVHMISAVYAGDANYLGSNTPLLTQTVNASSTLTMLSSSANPSAFGQSVTFTAAVSPAGASGSVTFLDGTTRLGSVALVNGTASLAISTLASGVHSVTAAYGGDLNNAASTSAPLAQTVGAGATTTTLSSTPNPSSFNQNVTLTASVTPSTATGTVTFKDGVNTLGTGTLISGVAIFSTPSLPSGVRSLTAVYGGDSSFASSTSSPLSQTVNKATTSTVLSSAPNPSVVGQSVSLVARVNPATTTGTITFMDGQVSLGTVSLVAGVASLNVSTLTGSAHYLTAAYSGDSNYQASTSVGSGPVLSFTSGVPNTIADSTGQGTGFPVRLPGTGTSLPANDPNLTLSTAAGTLTWQTTSSNLNGQVNLGPADFLGFPLSSAGVTLNEDFTFSATFRGVQFGNNFDQLGIFAGTSSTNAFRGGILNSTSANAFTVQTVAGTDQNQQTSLALAPSPGDNVTLSLSRVSGTWSLTIQNLTSPAKSGSIPIVQPTFLNQVPGLIAGVFALNTGNTSPWTETLTSVLVTGGSQNVGAASTTSVLTSSPNPSAPGQLVTLTATVSPSAATGTVTFLDGNVTLGTASLTNGVATFTTSALTTGSHSLTAVYAGTANYLTSTSAPVTQTVSVTASSTVLTSSLNPSIFGQNVTLTAAVTPTSATGTVTFKDGSTILGTGTLSGGRASFSTAGLTAGSHSLTAVYGGDVLNTGSVSAALTQTVSPSGTSVTLTSSVNPVVVGQPLTLRAAVLPSSATGTVTLKDGTATLGTAQLSAGIAVFSPSLPFGTHALTAVYGGDANNAAATSPVLNQNAVYPALLVSTAGIPSGTAGQPYGPFTFGATGGSGVYAWSASGLPGGLSLSSAGTLSGTPDTGFSGSITITVTDSISQITASASYSLSIAFAPLTISGPSSLGKVIVGGAVGGAFTAAGGKPPYAWAVTGAPGISIDATGKVSGTAASAGSFSVTVAVTDAQNGTVSKTATFSGFGITTSGLPPASTSNDYSAGLSAAGGTPPYTFTATGLPSGITFSGTSFGGRPLNPGSATIAVRATDSAGLTANASYTLTITGPSALTLFSSSLGDATVGQPYSASLSATGGTAPYTWSQSGGLLPAGLTLSDTGGITGTPSAPGPYSLGVQVSDANGNKIVGSVSINVKPAPLTITNGAVFPSGIQGVEYPSQILTASGGVPPYTFSLRGQLPSGLSLAGSQIAGSPGATGDFSFTLIATDSSQPAVTGLLGVTLNVRPASPDLVLAMGSASFTLTSGSNEAPSPVSIGVTSSVISQNIGFSASVSVPWLTVSSGSGTPGIVSVGPNAAALALSPANSPYQGSVTVSCTSSACVGKTQTVTVTLNVEAPPPQLTIGTTLLSFASLSSSPQIAGGSVLLTNSGGGLLKINSVTSDAKWLNVGTYPASIAHGPGGALELTADPSGLSPGYYRGTITVTSSGGSGTVAVSLFISAAATMTLGPGGTQFSMPQGGLLGNAEGSFNVSASSGATLTYTTAVQSASNWLTVSGGSGTASSSSPGTIGFSINQTVAATLTAGSYYGTVRVFGSGVVNSPQDFQVVLNVTPANTPVVPDPQPAGLVFVSAGTGALASQQISVYASSRNALPFQASASTVDGGNWLSISPTVGNASAVAPGQVAVSANPAGLKAGAYRGSVSFAFGSAIRSVNITLIVQPAQTTPALLPNLTSAARPAASGPVCANAQLVPTQTGLVSNFSAPTSWPTPLAIKLFDSCGSLVTGARITATFTNGDPPLPLTLVSAASGLYSGTWTPRKTASSITVSASVTAPGYPAASVTIAGRVAPNSAPVLAPNGAGDVFHPQVGAGLGPGNIVQIYGSGLAAQKSSPSTLPLPTRMGGTSVLIGGVAAPLFYVSPDQINAQIPFELTAGNQYQVIVDANGALTTPQPIQLNGGTPSILNFTSGAVVAQHLDGTLVLEDSPASPGEFIIIYSSGLGLTDIPVPSGTASPSDPPARVANPPVLTLNGNPIDVLFAGLTPGLVGLYQVNFQVPTELKSANYDLVLTQSGTDSNKSVLPVKQP